MSATAAPTNLMLHLIKTTHAGDNTPKDVGDVAWGLPALPLNRLCRPLKTKNSQAMAGSIHAPLVRIELCYSCPPACPSVLSSVLCLLAGVFLLENWSPCCYVSGWHCHCHSYYRTSPYPTPNPYVLDIDVDIQHRRTRYSLSGRWCMLPHLFLDLAYAGARAEQSTRFLLICTEEAHLRWKMPTSLWRNGYKF